MNKELITKKDYQILGIKENSTPEEINSAYEKLLQEYHPEKIKLEKYREPNDLEIKKYKEVEKVYKKFKLEKIVTETKNYVCCGIKEGAWCKNEFYPALWIKVEGGQEKYFCSQECYNSKFKGLEYDLPKRENEVPRSLINLKQGIIDKIKRVLGEYAVKIEELEPSNQNYEQEINNIKDSSSNQESSKSETLEKGLKIEKRVLEDIFKKSKKYKPKEKTPIKIYCDNCGKEIEQWREPGTNHTFVGIGSVDNEGNHYTFCSQECCNKGIKGKGKWIVRKNIFSELLKWMEKAGITNISVDQGKLILGFGKNQKQVIEDNDLTNEQKEIKNFLQSIGKNSLSQSEVKEEAKGKDKIGGEDRIGWVPMLGIGIIVLVVITLIGVIIYKNKKKGY